MTIPNGLGPNRAGNDYGNHIQAQNQIQNNNQNPELQNARRGSSLASILLKIGASVLTLGIYGIYWAVTSAKKSPNNAPRNVNNTGNDFNVNRHNNVQLNQQAPEQSWQNFKTKIGNSPSFAYVHEGNYALMGLNKKLSASDVNFLQSTEIDLNQEFSGFTAGVRAEHQNLAQFFTAFDDIVTSKIIENDRNEQYKVVLRQNDLEVPDDPDTLRNKFTLLLLAKALQSVKDSQFFANADQLDFADLMKKIDEIATDLLNPQPQNEENIINEDIHNPQNQNDNNVINEHPELNNEEIILNNQPEELDPDTIKSFDSMNEHFFSKPGNTYLQGLTKEHEEVMKSLLSENDKKLLLNTQNAGRQYDELFEQNAPLRDGLRAIFTQTYKKAGGEISEQTLSVFSAVLKEHGYPVNDYDGYNTIATYFINFILKELAADDNFNSLFNADQDVHGIELFEAFAQKSLNFVKPMLS
ncbi:MAG: DUF4234 domain-containing protein [Succinivibrio sp.]|nr:DUF4234 domain-containing protein [Succinivibrio sp.]